MASNLFSEVFGGEPGPPGPAADTAGASSSMTGDAWPPVAGEYHVLRENRGCRVAVSTLASVFLAEELAGLAPPHLCIVGKTETENIGIEKIIRNVVSNPAIHFLILAGKEPEGHRSGATLLALCRRGVDGGMKVVGSPGRRPVLRNVTAGEVEAFRKQVKAVDMIGCGEAGRVIERIGTLAHGASLPCSCERFSRGVKAVPSAGVETLQARPRKRVGLDRAGYFVILPLPSRGRIHVEHYANDNRLLRVIEGEDAANLYRTIIENGWVTRMTHAAYLGKELEKAELSMKLGFRYVQDGA